MASKQVKARVLVAFSDRENLANVYQVGETFTGTQERVDELAGGGYVKPIKTAKQEQQKES